MKNDWQVDEVLPKAAQAEIDFRKFTEYSINPSNSNNQGKWKAFDLLGYNVNSVQGRFIATHHNY